MRIKRFFENENSDISTERVNDMLKEVSEFISELVEKSKLITSMTSELSNYQNQSAKSNDQIDDSISSLQVAKKGIDDAIDKMDNVITNLSSYDDEGRKYLYTENK